MFRNTLLAPLILLIAHHVLAADGELKHAADKRPTKIWNRIGPLGDTPEHVTDAFPLTEPPRGHFQSRPYSTRLSSSRTGRRSL